MGCLSRAAQHGLGPIRCAAFLRLRYWFFSELRPSTYSTCFAAHVTCRGIGSQASQTKGPSMDPTASELDIHQPSTLYWKAVPVYLRRSDKDERAVDLTVRIIAGFQRANHSQRVGGGPQGERIAAWGAEECSSARSGRVCS